jgi:guanine deaminase
VTIYRARVMDTPDDPFTGGVLRAEDDAGIAVRDDAVWARGSFETVRADHPADEVVDLRAGILLPGLVDTHTHFPQVRAIGGLGMPLLDWLDRCALPEEARLADAIYARSVAADFVRGLLDAGTTTALVFGSQFPPAVDELFTEAARTGLRITAGLVLSDRLLAPEALLTTPDKAYQQSRELADRWHNTGKARYAVTPRFSYSASDALLDACSSVLTDVPGSWFTSHVNENDAEIASVAELFPRAQDYLDTYDRHGLVGRRSVLAHNVHPTDRELGVLAARDAAVAHCPTSNAALGSGMFGMRSHLEYGVRVSLGSDVGGGTGFCLFKEGLQAYFTQQLLGEAGMPLKPAHLLYLATAAGAHALGLADQVGDLSTGKQFDAVWLRPADASVFEVGLRHAADAENALAKIFALGTPADVAAVWIAGDRVRRAD